MPPTNHKRNQVGPRPIQSEFEVSSEGSSWRSLRHDHRTFETLVGRRARTSSVGRGGRTVGESGSTCRGDASGARWQVDRVVQTRRGGGGVRGIVAGDVIRRLVARTMSQQLAKTAEV